MEVEEGIVQAVLAMLAVLATQAANIKLKPTGGDGRPRQLQDPIYGLVSTGKVPCPFHVHK